MKKILYIITQSELGGAQKNVFDLAIGLKKDYEIIVAAGPDGGGDLFEVLTKNKIRCAKLKFLRRAINPLHDLAAFLELKRLIKKEQPDIVHLHSSKAGVLGSLAAKCCTTQKKPEVFYTVHGAVFEAAFWAPAKKFYLWLEKFSAHFKDKIICVSDNDKKLWLKYKAAPSEKLVVIHNGLDYQNLEFLPKNEARENLFSLSPPLFETARGSSPDLKIVGTIANLYPEKGLEFFVQAAEIILKSGPDDDIIFAVIGEGDERPLLEAMTKERILEKKFILTGGNKNAARYLKAFDVFVLPSIKEGLPYTILEAMAAGLPIVASYIGGIPEMVENETNGFLVLPKNSQALADKIMELIKNPELAERFRQNSLIKIKEFSLKKMITETENIYKNI